MECFKRYKLISCEILFREVSACAASADAVVDITFTPKGLHDVGKCKMRERIQQEIDKTEVGKYDAILLGYGMCSNGVCGLHSKLPMVIARGHDCITLLLGSKKRYEEVFSINSGVYFKSPGWIEREANPDDAGDSITTQLGMGKSREEYAELYGEENADFLMEMLEDWFHNYRKITFIDTNLGNVDRYKERSRKQADELNIEYDELQGDVRLIDGLLNGKWNEQEYCIIPPNHEIIASNDDGLISYAILEEHEVREPKLN